MRAMPKIERTTSLPSTPKASSVRSADASATAAVTTSQPNSQQAVATFAGQTAAARELVPAGKPVATSASVDALWGEAKPKPVSMDHAEFKALSQSGKAEVCQQAITERNQVGREIGARVEQLDKKWKNSRLTTRTEALREYRDRSEHLSPRRRGDLDRAVARSDAAQKRIDELKAKAAALPNTPEAKAQMVELRKELARELRRARSEQSAAVKDATAVVDQEGLKVDRLATTEQVIDPNAPKPGSGDTLLEKVAHFFKLDEFISWVFSSNSGFKSVVNEFAKQTEVRGQQMKEDHAQRMMRVRLEADREVSAAQLGLSYLSASQPTSRS